MLRSEYGAQHDAPVLLFGPYWRAPSRGLLCRWLLIDRLEIGVFDLHLLSPYARQTPHRGPVGGRKRTMIQPNYHANGVPDGALRIDAAPKVVAPER